MGGIEDDAAEGTRASNPMQMDETPSTEPMTTEETSQGDMPPFEQIPASSNVSIGGTPRNDSISNTDGPENQANTLSDLGRAQPRTTIEPANDPNDQELFVSQEPTPRQVRNTPHLTKAEMRESVRIGLDNRGAGKIPRGGMIEAPFSRNNNNNNENKKRKRSRANDVDISTLGGTNLVADARANCGQAPIPISTKANKQDALKEMVASLPADARDDAMPDKKLVIDATRKFTKKPRPDKKGGWKHVNLKTSLFHHQVLGAGFMRGREKSNELPKGGMLCDVMGFGKTIQTLANIVDDLEKLEDNANTTLIVAPRGVLDHWQSQIHMHVQDNVLRPILCHYAGIKNDSLDLELFLQSKIILTSYDEIRLSYPIRFKEMPEDMSPEELLNWGMEVYANMAGPLHRFRFRRIILDEAHHIRNPESQTSIAVRALHGHYKWIITGTPLLNHSAEFWAYFKFLGVPNIGRFSSFISNFCNGSDLSTQRLVNIIQQIVFRRTHRSRLFASPIITLPDLDERIERVKPFAIEKALYRMIVDSFVDQLNRLATEDEQSRCFLTMLLNLRMFNSHMLCVQDNVKGMLSHQENMTTLQKAVAESANDEANINRDIYVRLEELMHATQQAQTAQKNATSAESMLANYFNAAEDYIDDDMDWMKVACKELPSSKVLRTRDIIQEWFKKDPDTKLVIFTQFRAMTRIFYHMCKKERWACSMLTGEMNSSSRTRSLMDFQTTPQIKILIASLKAGGAGLDITAANKCILVEPWWNDAIQQQAFCRLFRIGQERDVEIVKLIAQGTIDEYMLELQEQKLKEIEGAIENARLPSRQLLRHFGIPVMRPGGGMMIRRPT